MGERKQDKLLNIRTSGIREWNDYMAFHYNRYEATPYKALKEQKNYSFTATTKF